MSVNWLIGENLFGERLSELAEAVKYLGMECRVASYVPFGGGLRGELFGAGECVISHCHLNMARHIRQNYDWYPGVYCNFPLMDCMEYYGWFGPYLLNQDYVMLPYGELVRRRGWFRELFGNRIFVRPSSGEKFFDGMVIETDLVDRIFASELSLNTMVVVSAVRAIGREWRLLVGGGRVISSSQYKNSGRLEVIGGSPSEVEAFGNRILSEAAWSPDPVWAMDICETSDGLSLLEIGSFSCSGLYAMDSVEVVRGVSEVVLADAT